MRNGCGNNWRYWRRPWSVQPGRLKDTGKGSIQEKTTHDVRSRAGTVSTHVAGFGGGDVPCSVSYCRSLWRRPDLFQFDLVVAGSRTPAHCTQDLVLRLRDS